MFLRRKILNERLVNLNQVRNTPYGRESEWSKFVATLDGPLERNLNLKLEQAGFINIDEQKNFIKKRNFIFIAIFFVTLELLLIKELSLAISIGVIVFVIYTLLLGYSLLIKFLKNNSEREIYYDTPLFLEELVLLIESGLALFPALQEICDKKKQGKSKNSLVRQYMASVYALTLAGLPMSDAFAKIARQTPFTPIKNLLLHLDVSSSVGGELIFALQSLAEQVHKEWKLEVETRVRKLENLVVFPVFAAVMGMMLMTAAVPLVPIMEFMNGIGSKSASSFKPEALTTLIFVLSESLKKPSYSCSSTAFTSISNDCCLSFSLILIASLTLSPKSKLFFNIL